VNWQMTQGTANRKRGNPTAFNSQRGKKSLTKQRSSPEESLDCRNPGSKRNSKPGGMTTETKDSCTQNRTGQEKQGGFSRKGIEAKENPAKRREERRKKESGGSSRKWGKKGKGRKKA